MHDALTASIATTTVVNDIDSKAYETVQFLTRLGVAMTVAGASVTEVQNSLTQSAGAYGLRSNITVGPTMILVQVQGQHSVSLDMSSAMQRSLRLDQVAGIWRLVERAMAGTIQPAQGLTQLSVIWGSTSRFAESIRLLGYMLMAVGFGLSLHPSTGVVIACILFGLVVGEILLLTEGHATIRVLLPVMTALGVGLLVFLAVDYGLASGPLLLLIPPLVTFLPGAMLTTGMMELTSGDIVSGSSRLVAGMVQLVLLLFGLLIAASIVGLPTAEAFSTVGPSNFWSWGPWAGTFIYGIGIYLHRTAPARSLPWLLLVLLVAQAGQAAGSAIAGGYLGGFFGALAMTPVAYAIQRWPSAPPAMVSILPAYWLLVPGALGLMKLTELVSETSQAAINDIGKTIYTLIAIALGVTVGQSVYVPLASWSTRVAGRIARGRTRPDPSGDASLPGAGQ
ncbi:MAG TPA: threonine/serine exporter family protein [Thermomicrobiales bacterium]|nr:threonine/serine exporter family protein [Thermomicrobiales bacterium]